MKKVVAQPEPVRVLSKVTGRVRTLPRVSPTVCGFHAPADNESSQCFVPTTDRLCQTRVSQFFPMMYMVNPCFFINRSFVTRRGLRAVFQPSSTFSK